MNIPTVILVFVITWWMSFFAALPIGVRAQNEGDDGDEGVTKGTVPSAPSNPNIKKKAKYVTLIAVVVTAIYYYLVSSGLVNMRPDLSQ